MQSVEKELSVEVNMTKPYPQKREDLNGTGNDGTLNAALVGATEDLEGTLLTPAVVPGVNAQPVRSTVLNTPANHLDGVTTKVLAGNVLVNTGGVGLEVLVDSEGNADGTLLHQLLLHVGDTLNRVRVRSEVLVLAVGDRVSGLRASGGTLGGGVLRESIASHHTRRRGDVVSARLHRVRLAAGTLVDISVVTASDDTVLGEPVPGSGRLTTIAALGERAGRASAASSSVLSGEDSGRITGGNAVTVIEGLGGTESPAGAAVTLVTNTASDGRALRPGGANIKALRDLRVLDGEGGLLLRRSGVALLLGMTVPNIFLTSATVALAKRTGTAAVQVVLASLTALIKSAVTAGRR